MCNKFKEKNAKNCTYYFFDDMINIETLDPNKININEKSYKNVLTYYVGYVTVKNLRYIKTNSVNPLYIIIDKIKRYTEESNGNRYLTVVRTDEKKDVLEKYEELSTKIRHLIRSISYE